MKKIRYIKGDLLRALDFVDYPVIVPHVCNNQGVMGAGFAKVLKYKYPQVMNNYQYYHELGDVIYEQVTEKILVANMVAQTLGGERPLYYNWLSRCMDEIFRFCKESDVTHIMAPAFGSGLAGGNWSIIEELIIDCWVRQGLNVTIFRLN